MQSHLPSGPPLLVVVMGVSGSGKTLLGTSLARALGGRFVEGDEHHPAANIARMADGIPLRDDDRWAWLDALGAEIAAAAAAGVTLVVACSALKRVYRDRLRAAAGGLRFVFLDVDRVTAGVRVAARKRHFMPASLVDSQFADLERPGADEAAIRIDATRDPAGVVAQAVAALTAPA